MSYALNTTKTIIAAVALAILIPSTGMADNMQIDTTVNVYERSSTGKLSAAELGVHVTDNGTLVILHHDKYSQVGFLMRTKMVAKLEALFTKGAEWGATAKESQVDIRKEIGTLVYNEKNKLTLTFVSCNDGQAYYVVVEMEMGYKDATFVLEPGVPAEIMSRLHKAPEVKEKLGAAMAAKAEKSKLFN